MPAEGQRQVNSKTGQTRVFTHGQWVLEKTAGASGDAQLRGKLKLGMGQMVQANQNLAAQEVQGGTRVNPLNRDWGAAFIDSLPDFELLSPLAKKLGGQDYQDYVTAQKQFESQVMPVMAGASQTPSEAKRQIQAVLPQWGDTAETLEEKAMGRKMMLNGAAQVMGAPMPYPDVPTYGVNSMSLPAGRNRQAGGSAPPQKRLTPQEAARLPKGTRFVGTDGVERVRQ